MAKTPSANRSANKTQDSVLVVGRDFVREISLKYPLKSAILFGSRARGTHRADSDVDIAIILRGPRGQLLETSLAMADIAFEVLLQTHMYIQPLPIWEEDWEYPEKHSNLRLLETIRREGVPL